MNRKVITTVGTSLFQNYFRTNSDARNYFDKLKNKSATECWDEYAKLGHIGKLKQTVWKMLEHRGDPSFSAETQSLLKIKSLVKEDLTVFLIATDTILSRLSAEIIREWFQIHYSDWNINFSPNPGHDLIKGLQVQNLSLYKKEGFPNLISRIRKIANNGAYWDDIAFNLTGGYKGIIPVLTTIAQVEGVPCYYLFQEDEESNPDLIEIPAVPLQINTDIFEAYYDEFQKISSDFFSPNDFSSEFKRSAAPLLYEEDGFLHLNEFCRILWDKFVDTHFVYYALPDVQNHIMAQPDLKNMLFSDFHKKELRAKNNVAEDSHLTVCKKFRNEQRIYYFEIETVIYIYKAFGNGQHDDHKRYINQTLRNSSFKESVIQKSKRFIINLS